MSQISHQIRLNVSTYTGVLLATAALFVMIHASLYLYHYRVGELPWLLLQLFDLNEENNLPTWFSSFLLLNGAFLLLVKSNSAQAVERTQWRVLAAGFLILAIDEVAGMHETFNTAIEMNWAIPGGILVGIVAIVALPFLKQQRLGLAALFVLSGIVYVSGAIIVELLSEDMHSESLRYMGAVTIEEGLEMLGAWLFLRTLMVELGDGTNLDVAVSIDS